MKNASHSEAQANNSDPILSAPAGASPNLLKGTLRGKYITLQFDNALSDTLPSIDRFTLNQIYREYLIVDIEIKANDGKVKMTVEKSLILQFR